MSDGVSPASKFNALDNLGVAPANSRAVKWRSPWAQCGVEPTLVLTNRCRLLLCLKSSLGMTRRVSTTAPRVSTGTSHSTAGHVGHTAPNSLKTAGGTKGIDTRLVLVSMVPHIRHADVQSLCNEGKEHDSCDIRCNEGYEVTTNTIRQGS